MADQKQCKNKSLYQKTSQKRLTLRNLADDFMELDGRMMDLEVLEATLSRRLARFEEWAKEMGFDPAELDGG